MKKYLSIITLLLLLTACADPLPKERLDYAGLWQSENMSIEILAEGTVSYQRVDGNNTTSVKGPLTEFIGDDFVVGVLSMTTTFKVSEPPHEVDGQWVMTVDGVVLTKTH